MKTKQELEQELEDMRKSNKRLWETYGSELSAGDMLGKEKELEDKIKNYYNKKNNFSNNDLIKLTVQLEKGVEQNLIGVEIYDENHKIIGNVETYNKETGVALINVTSKIKMKLVDKTPKYF